MRSKFTKAAATLVVAVALSAVAASAASASGGPEWLVAGAKLTGTKTVGSTGLGSFRIHLPPLTIQCQKESSSGGEIIGGNPGTGTIKAVFSGCSVEGKSKCLLSSGLVKGEIIIPFRTVLAYPTGAREGTGQADEAFVPEKSVRLKFTGECSSYTNLEVSLSASGSEIKEPAFNERCGLLAEVGKLKAGEFLRTASGVEAVEGALSFPEEPITKGELWQPGPQSFKAIECGMEVAGWGAAKMSGQAKVETATKQEFGWQV